MNASDWFAKQLDSTIAMFSPGWGLSRATRRETLKAISSRSLSSGAFEGVSGDRLRGDWNIIGGSADAETLSSLPGLRTRIRQLERNNPFVARMIQALKVMSLGAYGVSPQSRVKPDANQEGGAAISESVARVFGQQAEDGWELWTRESDAQSKLWFGELLKLHLETVIRDGEVFVRKVEVAGRPRHIPFALQTYEAEQISTPADYSQDRNVRDGIRIGDYGEPIEYYVRRSHPGNSFAIGAKLHEFDVVPASQMMHLGFLRRPGQTRYYSILAPALTVLQDIHRYWEAEIVAARVAACYVAFVKTAAPSSFLGGLQYNSTAGTQTHKTFEMSPGKVWVGNDFESVNFGNPGRPSPAFDEFTKQLITAAGMACDLPYIILTLDFSQSNYSNTRAATQEAREHADERKFYLVQHECVPVWESVVTQLVGLGKMMVPPAFNERRADYLRSRWLGPARKWIDPEKEANGALLRLKSRLSSYADELSVLGIDWEEHFEQVSRETERMRELDITTDEVGLTNPQKEPVKDAE